MTKKPMHRANTCIDCTLCGHVQLVNYEKNDSSIQLEMSEHWKLLCPLSIPCTKRAHLPDAQRTDFHYKNHSVQLLFYKFQEIAQEIAQVPRKCPYQLPATYPQYLMHIMPPTLKVL